MDLSVRTEAWTQDDQSWLGSQHGTSAARTITLDVSTFTASTHYPNGYFPSGLALGKITASGLYGPYDAEAGDGREDAAGFLFTAIKAPTTSAANVQGALLMHCFVVESRLPIAIDDTMKTATAGRIIYV